MNNEPFTIIFHRQNIVFEFMPSQGKMYMTYLNQRVDFDMKDVFFFHGWLGSMIMHFLDGMKKSGTMKLIMGPIKKVRPKSKKKEQPLLETSHESL